MQSPHTNACPTQGLHCNQMSYQGEIQCLCFKDKKVSQWKGTNLIKSHKFDKKPHAILRTEESS